MKKIIRLTESDLSRIVKQTINENVNNMADDLRGVSRRLNLSLDDYISVMKKGDSRKMEDSKQIVKRNIERMEEILKDLKRKL